MRSSFTPFGFEPGRPVSLVEQNLAIGNVRARLRRETSQTGANKIKTCEQLIVLTRSPSTSLTGAHAERFPGYGVTEGFFDALGVKAERGRTFLPEESESGREQVVVLNTVSGAALGGDPILSASRSR